MAEYKVTWLLQDGTEKIKNYFADDWGVQPNSVAIFIKKKDVTPIKLVQGNQAQEEGELVGAVAGYNSIEKV